MLTIIRDSREQAGFQFTDYDADVRDDTLVTGDYSLAGLTHLAAVERKSLADLVGSISQGRERFERELSRSMSLRAFLIVVEAPFEMLARGEYRSKMSPESAVQTTYAFMARYRTPFRFCSSRAGAEFATYHFFAALSKSNKARV